MIRDISKTMILWIFFALLGLKGFAQENQCRFEDGKIIFTLSLNWDAKKIAEFRHQFDLDSMVVSIAFARRSDFEYDSVAWTVKQKGKNIELIRNFEQPAFINLDDLILMVEKFDIPPIPLPEVQFGVNDFDARNRFSYHDGMARFFLKGFRNAKKVAIAGSFNEWSTLKSEMSPVDSGWIIQLQLSPGKYLYKYVVDGKWTLDPENKNKEKSDNSGNSSVVYCPNHTFSLKGHPNARQVCLAGNFNSWNPTSLPMRKTSGGWELPVYLREGTYVYKFIVDREWITDPENPSIRPDAFGNMNSFIGIGEEHIFRLKGFTNAQQVIVCGTFNHWRTEELLMNKTESGWELPYIIGQGNYEYKFIVDGQWITDPENPATAGNGEFTNSVFSFRPNHTFQLKNYPDAKEVIVTGSFNRWNTSGYRMIKQKEGWSLPLYLPPGKHLYKYIVDGEWMLDPGNKLWEENEFKTGNSILWISP